MNKTMTFASATLAALVLLSVTSYMSVQAQAVVEGVYTEAQAKRGEKVYAENCSFCHGDDLKGSDVIPALTGSDFVASWQGKTAADLFEKINTTMPATAPGTLTAEQSADSVAYMLSVAKYPAGTTELSAKMDELKQISIVPPKQ